MADSNFIFNLAFKTEGGEEVNRIRLNLDKLVAAQQRITSTSRQQGVAQKSLTEENKLFARATELSIQKLDRQRATLKKGSVEYARNNRATAVLQNSLNSLNKTNDRYNSTVIANQKREEERKQKLIQSAGATQKLDLETKSFISSLGQSTSMTERNISEANRLIGSIDKQISANQKLQRTVGLTRKQQNALVKEEQRLIKTKESLQSRISSTNNRFEQFKRTAATTRADLQRLSADNLRAGETTEAHKQEQERLEEVLEQLTADFRMLSEAGELSEQQMAQMSSTLAGVKGAALQTDRNIKGMSTAFTGQTKAVNSANQFLLSFGDIAQDSAQFQFGFGQGMRAIGNNVAFAGEQFTIFQQKVAASNKGVFTMRAGLSVLKGAFMGPAGILIAVNLAITAVTVLTTAFRKNKSEADALSATQKALSSAVKEHADAVKELRIETGILTKEQANSKEGQLELSRARLENAQILKDSILSQRDFDRERENVTEGIRDQVETLRELNFQQQIERTGSEAYAERRTLILQAIAADKTRFDLISQINREERRFNRENRKLLKDLNKEMEEERENIEKLEKAQEFLSIIEEEKLQRDKDRLFITGQINAEQFKSITANQIYAMTLGNVVSQEEEVAEQIDYRIKQIDDLRDKVFEFNTQVSLSDGISGLDLTDQSVFDAEVRLIESVYAVRRAAQLTQLDALGADANLIQSTIAMINAEEQQAIANLSRLRGDALKQEIEREESARKSKEDRDLRAFQQLEILKAREIENEIERLNRVKELQLEHLDTMDLTRNERLLEEFRINKEHEEGMRQLREDSAERVRKLNEQVASSSEAVNQQLISSLQASMTGLFGENKAAALLTLAVEKGLAIGKVLAEARAASSELEAEAIKMNAFAAGATAQGNLVAAGGFKAAAASATAGAVAARVTGRKNAAKIAAIGLLQGAAALSGGGGGGASAGGGGARGASDSRQPSIQRGFSEVDQPLPNYMPGREASRNGGVKQIVEFNLDETGFSFFTNRSTSVLGARTINLESSDA